MPHKMPINAGPRLCSLEGMEEAGMIEIVFDEVVGASQPTYTAAYSRILLSGILVFLQPDVMAAVATDDPKAFRAWIEREDRRLGRDG
jgi:hypothetical protein